MMVGPRLFPLGARLYILLLQHRQPGFHIDIQPLPGRCRSGVSGAFKEAQTRVWIEDLALSACGFSGLTDSPTKKQSQLLRTLFTGLGQHSASSHRLRYSRILPELWPGFGFRHAGLSALVCTEHSTRNALGPKTTSPQLDVVRSEASQKIPQC